jgi:hypothetical protein
VSSLVGCYPGSFNPPTVAHLALAEAAVSTCGLSRVDLVVSRVALAKESVSRPRFEHRIEVLQAVVRARSSWLGLVVTDHQLLVDLSAGYDVLVLGADKWAQVLDPAFYGSSVDRRDAAVAALPRLAVADRDGLPVPPSAVRLSLSPRVAAASSTGVREAGRVDWMVEEAADFDRATGAWSDPARYDAWVDRA